MKKILFSLILVATLLNTAIHANHPALKNIYIGVEATPILLTAQTIYGPASSYRGSIEQGAFGTGFVLGKHFNVSEKHFIDLYGTYSSVSVEILRPSNQMQYSVTALSTLGLSLGYRFDNDWTLSFGYSLMNLNTETTGAGTYDHTPSLEGITIESAYTLRKNHRLKIGLRLIEKNIATQTATYTNDYNIENITYFGYAYQFN